MYRINSDTYIDEKLITCMEYQLFIDEMRAQWKYYQPDHWTSYQFPAGQAQRPILGVRSKDAVAFCEWLSRQKGYWIYRLPTVEEANENPLQFSMGCPCGYWAFGCSEDPQLIWVKELVNTDTYARSCTLILARALDLDFTRARALNAARALDLDLVSTCALDLARALALDLDRDFSLNLDITLNRALARNYACDHNLARSLHDARARALHDALDLARDLNRVLARDLNRVLARTLDRVLARTLDRKHTIALERAQQIYSDLYLLQERIAGRYPAFEGIRIVKERKRDE